MGLCLSFFEMGPVVLKYVYVVHMEGFSTVFERVFESKENVMQPRPQCHTCYTSPLYARERKNNIERSTKLVCPDV